MPKMNASSFNTMNYERRTMHYANKNKANSNPIQTQFKPKQTQPVVLALRSSAVYSEVGSGVSINKSFKQSIQQFHWQAHHVCQAALDSFDKFIIFFFYRISARLIPPRAAFDMFGNLLVSYFLRVDSCTVTFNELGAITYSDNCNSGYDLMGPAEELSYNLLCLFGIAGLSNDLPAEIYDGVGADYQAILPRRAVSGTAGRVLSRLGGASRSPMRNAFCLGQRQALGIFTRADSPC